MDSINVPIEDIEQCKTDSRKSRYGYSTLWWTHSRNDFITSIDIDESYIKTVGKLKKSK